MVTALFLLGLEAMAAEHRGGDDHDGDNHDGDDGSDTIFGVLVLQLTMMMLMMYVVDLMTCARSKKESLHVCYSWYGAGE